MPAWNWSFPARVVGGYLLVALAWVMLSELVVMRFFGERGVVLGLQSLIGTLFALVTAAFLYGVLNREYRRVEQAEQVARTTANERDRLVGRVQLILERMPIGCVMNDIDGRVTYWNPAAERIFGFPADEVLGRLPQETYIPQSAVAHVENITRRLTAGELYVPSINENTRKDGRTIVCEWINTPLYAEGGRLVGFLAMVQDVTARRRDEEALRAALQEVQLSRTALERLSQRLIDAQERERRHIARELHDEIGQALGAIKINLHLLATQQRSIGENQRFIECLAIIDQLIQQVRSLSLDLRPAVLDDLGLAAALEWYVDRLAHRTGLDINLTSEVGQRAIPQEIATACFRVAQEALTNVVRHAGARRAGVDLQIRDHRLHLIVSDDGVGFDVAEQRAHALSGTSLGLLSMLERAELAGGRVDIESTVGAGSTIRAVFPLPATGVPAEPPLSVPAPSA